MTWDKEKMNDNDRRCVNELYGENNTVTETDKRFKDLHDRMTNGEATAEEIVEYMKLAEEKYK